MSGSVPFEQALAARLSLFNPSLSQVQDFLEKQPPRYIIFLIAILVIIVLFANHSCLKC